MSFEQTLHPKVVKWMVRLILSLARHDTDRREDDQNSEGARSDERIEHQGLWEGCWRAWIVCSPGEDGGRNGSLGWMDE